MSAATGTVQSHTIIRVPDKAHAEQAPFVLLLVALDGGRQVLGHFNGSESPAIGSRVTAETAGDQTPVFRLVEKS
jgi:uncharacterized OB-fold protein